MGNYISKVTPVRPVFGKKLDESSIIVGEEILETPNGSELKQEQSPNKESLRDENHESPDQDEEDEQVDGEHTNGHTNGHSNGHTNGHTNGQSNGHSSSNNHHSNGHSDADENGHSNGVDEELDEEEDGEQTNGNLNKSDLKSKKEPYSKRAGLINEVDPVEPQPDEEELEQYEVVGRKRKGRKSATPKKQYKKRKNLPAGALQKVNELEVDE